MTNQLLKNADIYPSADVIKEALVDSFDVFEKFASSIKDAGLEIEWRFYNDGKTWLAKAIAKKKTVLWISIWDGFFKVSFFFTDRAKIKILELPINSEIKENMLKEKAIGKIYPLVIEVHNENQINDILTLITYKLSIK